MQKKSVLFITLSFLTTSLFLNTAHADIEWSGVYRIEANNLSNSELGTKRATGSGAKRELNYALSHLVLRPKIVAGDGLTIYSQFDIFNNATYGANSQFGQIWGSGVNDTGGAANSIPESNTLGGTQKAETLQVSQLYMTLSQEYGALVVGRVPIQFGLGMTYSAGNGLFDHWYDTDDMVGYKFVLGNLWIMPMYGKTSESNLNLNSDDVNDMMVQLQYDAPESDIELGLFYKIRTGGEGSADGPNGFGGATPDRSGKVNLKTASIYLLKDTPRFRAGLEASFQSGDSGVKTSATGDNTQWEGYGIAAEFELRPDGSNWKWGLKAGTASGDDPTTDAKYEGFLFNRNYDVAMLMFNHPLGVYDVFRTDVMTGGGTVNKVRNANGDITAPDVEALSNVMYLAPTARYTFNDKWSLDNTIITGWLGTNPLGPAKNPGKDLGYEWDVSLNYSPKKGVLWVNQAGFLFPGGVWKGDGQYDSAFAFGVSTKAAISF